jgi:tyrosinase
VAHKVLNRQDVWVLSTEAVWHPTIEWYARAVGAMQQRDTSDLGDPTSWAHLAAIHGTALPKDRWPRGAKLHECQHSSWFFLPWHRIYLHHFEKIVRATVTELGGPPDWSLPFWDYSDQARPDVRKLPPAFRRKTLPGGGRNPLYVVERRDSVNAGKAMDPADTNIEVAFADIAFTEPDTTPGFGGPVTDWWHGGGPVGSLELAPHGSVHMAVGGSNPPGRMSRFDTAATDPIFWLHHANIDRLWDTWLARGAGRANPTAAKWVNKRFSMGTGVWRTELAVKDVLDTTNAVLRYRYDGVRRPAPRRRSPALVGAEPPRVRRPAKLGGATDRPVPLSATTTAVDVPVQQPATRRRGIAAATPQRVFLKLEHVTGTSLAARAYNVFVNLKVGVDPEKQDRRAGRVSMFGVMEASNADEAHAGSGLTFSFEITDLVRRLEADNDWDPANLRVMFIPVMDGGESTGAGDVTVGRVSVYFG